MSNSSSDDATSLLKSIIVGHQVLVYNQNYTNYPIWFWFVTLGGVGVCTVSCIVWFFCAICTIRKDKQCDHTHFSEQKRDDAPAPAAPCAPESKKVEALNEAEALAKSFKSVRSSKRSSKRSSRKSSKASDGKKSAESADEPKSGSKEPSEQRVEGGSDGAPNSYCAIEMEDNGAPKSWKRWLF